MPRRLCCGETNRHEIDTHPDENAGRTSLRFSISPGVSADLNKPASIKKEATANLLLMIPLALTQLATTALGITNILIMGWSGSAALAAGTLSVHLFTFFSVFVGGLLTSASPLIAHSIGAGNPERAKRVAGEAINVALILAIVKR